MKQRVLAQRNILSKQRQIIRNRSFCKAHTSMCTHTEHAQKRGMQKSNRNGERESEIDRGKEKENE